MIRDVVEHRRHRRLSDLGRQHDARVATGRIGDAGWDEFRLIKVEFAP